MTEDSARERAEDIDVLLGLRPSSALARWKKPVIIGGLVTAGLVVALLVYLLADQRRRAEAERRPRANRG